MAEHLLGVAVVAANGTAVDTAGLVDARVEQSLHAADRFVLRFRDPRQALLDAGTFDVGTVVVVSAKVGSSTTELLKGEVTQLAFEMLREDQQELVVTGMDARHRLARGVKTKTWLECTDTKVVSDIAKAYGLTAQCDAPNVKHAYLLQSSTDYAFLSARAAALGCRWWVDGTKLHFKKAPKDKGPKLTWGKDLRAFSLRVSSTELAEKVVIRSWDPTQQRAVVGEVPLGAGGAIDGPAVAAPLVDAVGKKGTAGGYGKGDRFSGTLGAFDGAEAKALAGGLATRAWSEQAAAVGEALGTPAMRAGQRVTIEGIGKKLNGTYLVTTVEHVFTEGRSFVTRFSCGGIDSATAADVATAPPTDVVSGWSTRGVVIGIVTNNDDPQRQGRVKVKYPTLTDTDESAWCRVLSVGAGVSRGLQSLPDPQDEVAVAFEHGDPRRPIVLGGLWSGKFAPPDKTHGTDFKTVTLQSKRGHVLTLKDGVKPADNVFSVALKDKQTLLKLSEADGIAVATPQPVKVDSMKTVTIKAIGDLVIEAANITLKAQGKVAIAGAVVEAKADGQAVVQAPDAQLKGTATATVEGGTMAQIKGAVVKIN